MEAFWGQVAEEISSRSYHLVRFLFLKAKEALQLMVPESGAFHQQLEATFDAAYLQTGELSPVGLLLFILFLRLFVLLDAFFSFPFHRMQFF